MQGVPPNDGEKPHVHFPPPSGPPPAQYQHEPSHEHYVPPTGPSAAQYQQEPSHGHYAPPAGPSPAQHQPSTHDQYIPPAGAGGGFPPPPAPPVQHPNEAPIPEYNADNVQFNVPPAKPEAIELSEEERRHARGKSWSTRMHHLGAKAAAPINALVNKMGSQAFLPSTMDKECEKAAAILLSFCAEGAYGEGHRPTTPTAAKPGTTAATVTATATPNATSNTTATAPGATVTRARSRDRALFTIPQKVLSKAVGLAIFTTARVGFEVSLATGSGVLVARLPDGSWGPPSAIQVHTLGAGFLVGLDIYDCVCVINTHEALSAFTRTRVALGTEVSVAAGPFGAGGKVDVGTAAGHPRRQDGPPLLPSEKPADHAVSAGETYPGQHQQKTAATTADGTMLSADPQRPDPQHRRSSSKTMGPVFTYVKSRGFFAGVHVDGTVITERKEANHAFYGERLPAERILRREGVVDRPGAKLWPAGARVLAEALRKAERERPHDEVIVPPAVATPAITQPPPKVEPVSGYGPPAVAQSGPRVDPMDGYAAPAVPQSGPRFDPMDKYAADAQSEPRVGPMDGHAAPMPKVEPVGGQAGDGGVVPAYVEAPNDGPPPYADDGTAHPGVGDHKVPPPQ